MFGLVREYHHLTGAYIQGKATMDGFEGFLVERTSTGGLTIRNLNMIVRCVRLGDGIEDCSLGLAVVTLIDTV